MPQTSRSVVDFDTEDALRKALMAVHLPDNEESNLQTKSTPAVSTNGDTGHKSAKDENLDWVLPSYDAATTEVQSMKEELHRLQVLKSYLILDADREEAFERITGLASRIYNVPIALISIVDLGRQWFMSNRGLGDVRETPRKHAFCAHAILNKHNILIVPDATKDFRFDSNPLVTGPPNIRFYAGAPLVSPEGYKLGTLCIIDSHTRPAGLSQDEQATLRDFADMAVKELVDRRYKMQTQEKPAQLIAYTAHDLMTPLTGVQLSLSILKEDEEVSERLGAHHLELLTTASNCSELMIRICQTAIDNLRQDSVAVPSDLMRPTSTSSPVTKLEDLVKSLSMIMDPIPKQVPLIITLDPSVPPIIMSDDLKLFRSALNLLSNAAERTTLGFCHLKIFAMENKSKLVFECTDSGEHIEVSEYQYLFRPSRSESGDMRLGLSSVASLVHALDGEYGFRPRGVAADGLVEDSHVRGSIFWFSVPLFLPDSFGISSTNTTGRALLNGLQNWKRFADRRNVPDQESKPIKAPIIPTVYRSGSNHSFASIGQSRVPIVVGDIFQAEAVAESCFGDCYEPTILRSERSSMDQKMPARPLEEQSELQSSAVANAVSLAAAAVAKGPRKRCALIIEDSTVVRKSISMALERMSFDVTQASDGLEGLRALKEEIFDLVLCDFLMPVMDGMDCVQQYRVWEKQNRPWFTAYIVGISAHATANDGGRGIKAGMSAFRHKPISIKTLKELQESEAAIACQNLLDDIKGSQTSSPVAAHIVVDAGSGASDAGSQACLKRQCESAVSSDDEHRATRPSLPPLAKKSRTLSNAMVSSETQVCLIATDTPSVQSSVVLPELESQGWKVVVVHDGEDALRLLRMRNWDVVLIDDDLPELAGAPCITRFREWEEQSRVNKQRNMFLVCNGDIPLPYSEHSIIHPPAGVNAVLKKPVEWDALRYLIQLSDKNAYEIVVRK